MEAQGLPILNSNNNPMCMLGIVTCPLWTSGLDDLKVPFWLHPSMTVSCHPFTHPYTQHSMNTLTRTCATCYQGKARSLYQVSIKCHVSMGNNIGDIICIYLYIYIHIYTHTHTRECVLSHLIHVPLCENPIDCSPPGSSVHGILQVRILDWVAMLSSRGSSWPRDWTCACVSHISCTGRRVLLPLASPGKPVCVCVCVCVWCVCINNKNTDINMTCIYVYSSTTQLSSLQNGLYSFHFWIIPHTDT